MENEKLINSFNKIIEDISLGVFTPKEKLTLTADLKKLICEIQQIERIRSNETYKYLDRLMDGELVSSDENTQTSINQKENLSKLFNRVRDDISNCNSKFEEKFIILTDLESIIYEMQQLVLYQSSEIQKSLEGLAESDAMSTAINVYETMDPEEKETLNIRTNRELSKKGLFIDVKSLLSENNGVSR